MRTLRFFATTSLSLSAVFVLFGCSSEFVDPFTTTSTGDTMTSGGTGSAGTGSGGSGGHVGVCPNDSVTDNLLSNPSFEDTSAWVVNGGVIDYPLADDCSFACGSRFGHVSAKMGGGNGSVDIIQALNRKVELGAAFTFNAHFRFTATYAPYFGLIVNGYPAGGTYINGISDGKHLAIKDFEVQLNDPRRTGTGVQANMYAGYDDMGMDATFDCFALTYAPPKGVELLPNGWFDGAVSDWAASNTSVLTWDPQNGYCGPSTGAARVKVPANAPKADIRGSVTGSWPIGTKFRFGGAVRPLDTTGNVTGHSLTLHLDYESDNVPATDDFVDVVVPVDTTSDNELWKPAVGEVTATRTVIKATMVQKGDGASNVDQEYLADCFSLRAIPAP
jgi:hypothetical protein